MIDTQALAPAATRRPSPLLAVPALLLAACGGGGGSSHGGSGPAAIQLAFESAATEVPESGVMTQVRLLLSHPSQEPMLVRFEYSGDTTPGEDFVALDELVVPAQTSEAIFVLPLLDDELDEYAEVLVVRIAAAEALEPVDFEEAELTVTLTDDDEPPQVEFGLIFQQTAELAGEAHVPVVLDHPSGKPISARVAVTGDAALGVDFALDSDELTIAPGEQFAMLRVTLFADGLSEDPETVLFELIEAQEGELGGALVHELRIVDWFGPHVVLHGFEPNGYAGLYTAGLGAGPAQLVVPDGQGLVKSFRWSPNGGHVAYLSDVGTPEVFQLWVVDAGGGAPVLVSDPLVPEGEIDDYAWSADGEWLAYSGDCLIDEVDELFSVPRGGGGALRVSQVALPDGDVKDFAWSPLMSERRLVYRADETLFDEVLYAVDESGAGHARLSPPSLGRVTQHAWSPQGEQVGFLGLESPSYHLFVVPADGSQPALKRTAAMGAGGTVAEFEWTPSGEALVFRAAWLGFGQYEILSVGAASGQALDLSQLGAGALLDPLWRVALDGSRVAFVADVTAGGGYELYTVRLDGSQKRVVSPPLGAFEDVERFAWSPDSADLAFALARPSGRELLVVDALGSAPAVGISSIAPAHDVIEFAWDPAASRVAYSAVVEGEGGTFQLFTALAPPEEGLRRISGVPVAGQGVVSFAWAAGGARIMFGLGSGIVPQDLRSGLPFVDDSSVSLSGPMSHVLNHSVW